MFHPYQRLSRLRYERDILRMHEILTKDDQPASLEATLIDEPTAPIVLTTESEQQEPAFTDNESVFNDSDSEQEAAGSDLDENTGKTYENSKLQRKSKI